MTLGFWVLSVFSQLRFLDSRMLRHGRCSGFYCDLPNFGPLESISFLETVGGFHLHKLSERLLRGSRNYDFFFSDVEVDNNEIPKVVLPSLAVNFESRDRAPIHSFIHIEEVTTRNVRVGGSSTRMLELDLAGIDVVWQGLLRYYSDAKDAGFQYVIPNIDLFLVPLCRYGHFMFSILMIGISAIIHFFEGKGDRCEPRPRIIFTVLAGATGCCIGDAIQTYVENELKLVTVRNEVHSVEDRMEWDSVSHSSNEEWVDGVKELLLCKHEDYCEMNFPPEPELLPSPVIVLILGNIGILRALLTKSLLDSYSSEPIQVVEDKNWSESLFKGNTPVIFICSSSWLAEQGRTPKTHRILCWLNIKSIVHCSVCEFGSSLEEELRHSISLVQRECANRELDIQIRKMPIETFCTTEEIVLSTHHFEHAANMILLLFRRYLLRYSPKSLQPQFSLPYRHFFSEDAWWFYKETAEKLNLCGAVISNNDDDWPVLELTVLGRALSFRFRMTRHAPMSNGQFSLVDAKIVLWCHLFRMSAKDASRLISERYIFSDWVNAEVDTFCQLHHLKLTDDDGHFFSLVRQLSVFGFSQMSNPQRVHTLLSFPRGSRIPIQQHFDMLPTTCRGWFDRAPLNAVPSMEKRQVSTFCLPPLSAYCELEGPNDFHVQCPTEVSYPLIVAHSVLHISLHNNCIFIESGGPNVAVPLPLSLLQSGSTSAAILEDCPLSNNSGVWLDGSLSEANLAPTDPSILSTHLHHGQRLLGFCERSAFKRKRKRPEDSVNEMQGVKKGFTGTLPRTAAEGEIIEDFVKLLHTLGREKSERRFAGRKGFGFLEKHHDLFPYYQHLLDRCSAE